MANCIEAFYVFDIELSANTLQQIVDASGGRIENNGIWFPGTWLDTSKIASIIFPDQEGDNYIDANIIRESVCCKFSRWIEDDGRFALWRCNNYCDAVVAETINEEAGFLPSPLDPTQHQQTVYLMSALPNSLLVPSAGAQRTIKGITLEQATTKLQQNFVSAVGHRSTALLYSRLLGISVTKNRINVNPEQGLTVIAGIFTPPRRLVEGETWSEAEILSMPINWVEVEF